MVYLSRVVALLVSVAYLAPSVFGQSFLFDLQGLPISDEFNSQSNAVSADGSTIVGQGTAAGLAWRLRVLPLLNGTVDGEFLGTLPGGAGGSNALGVSADGSVVVGGSNSANGPEAFRWTSGGGMVGLGDLAGGAFGSGASGVSDDGTIVVGTGISPGGTLSGAEAYRWTQGTMVGLGDLPGGDSTSSASGVSADGAVVVGVSSSALSGVTGGEAFRWENGVMTPLGDLPGGAPISAATAISADGAVVVGASSSALSGLNDVEAFRWENGTMTPLGDLPGGNFNSVATGVSADGSVIVGYSAVAIGDGGLDVFAPFIWDQVNGMQNLIDVFTQLGHTMPNLVMVRATDVSDDGLTITGNGTSVFRTPAGNLRTEAWVGRLPEPSSLGLLLGVVTILYPRWRQRGRI